MVATFDTNPERAWPNDDIQEKFVQEMIPHIVAFEIPITRLQAKAKLSQNHPAGDRARVVAALQDSNQAEAQALAKFMRDQKI
jgi:transcriptional regulator